jgi:hypothetical protein
MSGNKHIQNAPKLFLRIGYECLAIALFVLAVDVWAGRSIDFPVSAQWLATGMFVTSICTSLSASFQLKGVSRKLAAANIIAAIIFGLLMIFLPRLSR